MEDMKRGDIVREPKRRFRMAAEVKVGPKKKNVAVIVAVVVIGLAIAGLIFVRTTKKAPKVEEVSNTTVTSVVATAPAAEVK